jgi:ribosome-associated protein
MTIEHGDDEHQQAPTDSRVELAPRVRVPASMVRFRFVRARGPGGQNVNKVSTACELRVSLSDLVPLLTPGATDRLRTALGSRLTAAGEIQLVSDEQRSQEQNREAVLRRLRELLVSAMAEPKRRKKTKPSRGAKQRRLEGKRIRSEIKSRRSGRIE